MQCPAHLLNIDLCLLAYQIYHQSLIWPLDPWYERMARKTSNRRNNFMAKVHEWARQLNAADSYSGPACARGWTAVNTSLDPVITNYMQLNPRLPGFSRDGTNFLAMKAPDYIVNAIQTVSLARYTSLPSGSSMQVATEIVDICDYPDGSDHLIAFEGGTGNVSGPAAWSIMGYVLMRRRDKAQLHDVHIVFRGSRSGVAGRAAFQGIQGYGNPDWTTDMNSLTHARDTEISKIGNVGKGFSKAVKTTFGTILAAVERISQLYGPPQTITVSGHSLGAALAAQFTSAVAVGSLGDVLRNMGTASIRSWPWDSITCVTYAQPDVGDKEYSVAANLMVNGRHIWVDGDAVVWAGEVRKRDGLKRGAFHLGKSVKLATPRARLAKENAHEPHLIRMAIIENAEAVRPIPDIYKTKAPWAYYKSFSKMLAGDSKSYSGAQKLITEKNYKSVLQLYNFGIEFDEFLKVFQEVVAMKSSYKMSKLSKLTKMSLHSQSSLDRRAARVAVVARTARTNLAGTAKKQLLDDLVTQVTAIEGAQGENTDKYLGTGIILNALQRSSLTIADINSRPKLKACLDFEV